MPVYVKKVGSTHPTFQNRETVIATPKIIERIPVPNSVTLCNGCNQNIDSGYLVYLGKREVQRNQPYDYYCESCLKRYFKGYKLVGD